ncbi:MAG TPA: ABC transporter permease [Mycobacteriales bacterium]|nr:ABC transporter permease [Mycobacteriales bacterium]
MTTDTITTAGPGSASAGRSDVPRTELRKTDSRIPRTLRHALVMARRNLIKTMRTPEQLIDVTFQPIIFLLMFTYIFGGAITGGSTHDYLEYLLPGMLGQSIAMGSVALGQNMNADIEKGVFDRFRSLPIARSTPLVAAVLADFFRYLLLCGITLGFGYAIGFRIQTGFLPTVAAIGLSLGFALCFCWISVFIGMKARTSGSVQGIMFLIVLPLSFASSTFVKPSTMPRGLRDFVDVNPISHLVGTTRGLMVGGPVASNLAWTLGWMVGLLVVFVPLAVRGYNKRA